MTQLLHKAFQFKHVEVFLYYTYELIMNSYRALRKNLNKFLTIVVDILFHKYREWDSNYKICFFKK